MNDKYINPFTDFGFKKLFGEEPNKDLLIDFLNALLKLDCNIADITYLRNSRLGNTLEDRKAIFDIYCENELGEKFIVEMQKAKQNFFKDRSLYYSTFPIQEQAITGEWNFDLKAIYTIGILDFVFDENKNNADYFHWEVKLMETHKKEVFFDKLTYVYLEMPKFTKAENELESHFEKWMFILKHLSALHERPEKLQERIFEKVFNIAEIANFKTDERNAYEESLKIYRDLKNVTDTAFSEGKIEGKIEGLTSVAKSMLSAGELIEKIIAFTGLTKEQISNLDAND